MKDRLTTAPLPLERPQGYFVLFVGRRYYLRPIILWNALRPLEQSLALSGTPAGG